MTPGLSQNAQAILLVTAPLIAGRSNCSPDILSPGEYKQLARRLREIQRQPADLLSQDASDVIQDCRSVVDESRLHHLLGRGFLLGQVVERWQSRAIWVVSRADANYPSRLKARLKEDAPAVLYGSGDIGISESGGLAVVGSRGANEALIAYTKNVGRLAADAGKAVVSGGARGIDQAAMRGALEQGGKAMGTLADSLERSATNRENRDAIINGKLLLISPYDPAAGFNVGNAMRRNRLIYALADLSLVIEADVGRGGTWAGATEQLDRMRMVPVYVRSAADASEGLEALLKKGAMKWPEPKDVASFMETFKTGQANTRQAGLSALSPYPLDAPVPGESKDSHRTPAAPSEPTTKALPQASIDRKNPVETSSPHRRPVGRKAKGDPARGSSPVQRTDAEADAALTASRASVQQLLIAPMKESEVAAALDISLAQARILLKRFVQEGVVENRKKPNIYLIKQPRLFG